MTRRANDTSESFYAEYTYYVCMMAKNTTLSIKAVVEKPANVILSVQMSFIS